MKIRSFFVTDHVFRKNENDNLISNLFQNVLSDCKR